VIIEKPLEMACRVFLQMMMRESVARHPERQIHTVPEWDRMAMADRLTIARSIAAAVNAANKLQREAATSQATT